MRVVGRQFKRVASLTVGLAGQVGRKWSELDISFAIKKTSRSRPNKATIEVTNLSSDSRAFLELDGSVLQLAAGYVGDVPALFVGDVDTVKHELDKRDWKTTIEARDGGLAWAAGVQEVWSPPLDSTVVLRRLADKMGVALRLAPELTTVEYGGGFTLAGAVRLALDEVTRAIDGEWSILDGELVVIPRGSAARQEIWLLSPGTGLVGSPEKTKKGNGLKLRALLNGRIQPGDLVQVEATQGSGTWLVRSVEHQGSNRGGDWYTDLELKAP